MQSTVTFVARRCHHVFPGWMQKMQLVSEIARISRLAFPRLILALIVMITGLPGPGHAAERVLATEGNLRSVVDEPGWCKDGVAVKVYGRNRTAFRDDPVGMQRLLDMLKAALAGECAQARSIDLTGIVGGRVVYRAWADAAKDWKLQTTPRPVEQQSAARSGTAQAIGSPSGNFEPHPIPQRRSDRRAKLAETANYALYAKAARWCVEPHRSGKHVQGGTGAQVSLVLKKGFDDKILLDQEYRQRFERELLPAIRQHCRHTGHVTIANYIAGWRISSATGQIFEYGQLPRGHLEAALSHVYVFEYGSGGHTYRFGYFRSPRSHKEERAIASLADLNAWHKRYAKMVAEQKRAQQRRDEELQKKAAAQPLLPTIMPSTDRASEPEQAWYFVSDDTISILDFGARNENGITFTSKIVAVKGYSDIVGFTVGETNSSGVWNLEAGKLAYRKRARTNDRRMAACGAKWRNIWLSDNAQIVKPDRNLRMYRVVQRYSWAIETSRKCDMYEFSTSECRITRCSKPSKRPTTYLTKGLSAAKRLHQWLP